MKVIASLALVSAALAAPAFADQPHYQIVGKQFFGDCGPDGSAKIDGSIGVPGIELTFTRFETLALPGVPYAHTDCTAEILIQPDPGYQVALTSLFYQGNASIAPGGSFGSRVTVNGYFDGTEGIEGIQAFPSPFLDKFTVHATDGLQPYSQCGQLSRLNLAADAVVYNPAGTQSDVVIRRGSGGTTDVEAPIYCGIQVQPCF